MPTCISLSESQASQRQTALLIQKLALVANLSPNRTMDEEKLTALEKLKAENERLKTQNQELAKALGDARTTIRRAKDPRPYQRPNFISVLRLVSDACMNLCKVRGGWELSMGKTRKRKFRFLKQVWEIFTQEDWSLCEVLPPAPIRRSQQPRLPFRHPVLVPRAVAPALSLSPVPSG